MQLITKSQVTRVQATKSTSFVEYFFTDKRLGGAYIEINGRYPDTGFAVNGTSSELAYILKGSGTLASADKSLDFNPGDALFIPPKEKFRWEGTFTMYVVTSPAFDPKQHTFHSR